MILLTCIFVVSIPVWIYLYWPILFVWFAVWAWAISFFRDPERDVPAERGVMVAPADGKVTHIVELDHDDEIGGPARKISIFLSVFNVHINRSPCAGRVRSIAYREGEYVNAMNPESSHRNEANTVVLDGEDGAPSTVIVRQIAGAIARRIVCRAKVDDRLAIGQRFGMIKFGSRTELTIPKREGDRVTVEVGQAVRAGETIMIRLSGEEPEGGA